MTRARAAILDAQKQQAKYFNQSRRTIQLSKGDLALLSIDGIDISCSPKYSHKYMGPFEVVDVLENDNYKLALPHFLKIHDIFHISKLSKYNEPDASSLQAGFTRPPPDDVENHDNKYFIDRIEKHRFKNRRKQYLCKWEGYDRTESTWECADKILADAPRVVEAYEMIHSGPVIQPIPTVQPKSAGSSTLRRSTRKRKALNATRRRTFMFSTRRAS